MRTERTVELSLHPMQRNVDFAYFEAKDDSEVALGERTDGYYFPKRVWIEMNTPATITITVAAGPPAAMLEDASPVEGEAL